MWGLFWAAFGEADFEAHKTLGHATSADVDAGRSTHWERRANDHADSFAKRGAARHALGEPDEALWRGLRELAKEACRWSATLEAELGDGQRLDHEDRGATQLSTLPGTPPGHPARGEGHGGGGVVERPRAPGGPSQRPQRPQVELY